VVGVADYKDLMEKIPNKIKNQLGITAEVNLYGRTTAKIRAE
jgi:ATP-dependent DNA helicase RecG